MKAVHIVIFPIILSCFKLSAQIKPGFFPEETGSEQLGVRCYCKPGIKNKTRSKGLILQYELLAGGDLKEEDTPFESSPSSLQNLSRFNFKLKYPLINKEHWKVLLGLKYVSEKYKFNKINSDFNEVFTRIDDQLLVNNSADAIITRSWDEKYYSIFRIRYGFSGDAKGSFNFNTHDEMYSLVGLFAKKATDNFEWGLGFSYSKSFRRTNILPFILFNKNFNRRWGVESAFPANIFLRYNHNSKTILYTGAEYVSQSFRIKANDQLPNNFNLNHSEVQLSSNAEVQLYPWIWLYAKAGYQLNFSTDFDSSTMNFQDFKVEPKDGVFFKLGVFISPPDAFMDKKH